MKKTKQTEPVALANLNTHWYTGKRLLTQDELNLKDLASLTRKFISASNHFADAYARVSRHNHGTAGSKRAHENWDVRESSYDRAQRDLEECLARVASAERQKK